MDSGILVVDDDKDFLGILRSIFEQEGIKAHYATNGEEAVERLKENLFAVMITDLNMPGMDGIELAMIAKEMTPKITVVMMTGDISPDIPHQAANAGISKVLAKPLSPLEILTLAKRITAQG